MNLYFLVEGSRTEYDVYPAWLNYLLPEFRRVTSPGLATRNSYYLISGEGYPSILNVHLPNAVKDINSHPHYDFLIVCVDADELNPEERLAKVHEIVDESRRSKGAGWALQNAKLHFVVQNRTIETWFLGNRKMISDAPQRDRLRNYLAFHDTRVLDPERMKLHPDFDRHAEFHHEYLKETFRDRGMTYRKNHPGHVKDKAYLEQLLLRISNRPNDLKSFREFIDFCSEVDRLSKL